MLLIDPEIEIGNDSS